MRFTFAGEEWELRSQTSWDEIWSERNVASWRRVLAEDPDPTPFCVPEVVQAWYEIEGRRFKPFFCAMQNLQSGNSIYWPLVNGNRGARSLWLNSLRPCGEYVFDYLDPLIGATSVGAREAISAHLPVLLAQIVRAFPGADGSEVARIREKYGPSVLTGEAEPCPFIDLTSFDSPDAYLRSLKAGLRGDLRRQRKRLEQVGEVQFRSYAAHELEDALAAFPAFMDARRARWGEKGPEPAIFERMLHRGLPSGIVHFSSLNLNGQPISWHLGLAQRSTFYYYIPAYTAEFGAYSPGKLHLAFLIEHALAAGYTTFDLLRGAENYKFEWTNTTRGVAGIKVPGTRASTGIRMAGHRAGRALKRGVRAFVRRLRERTGSEEGRRR